MTRIFYGTPIKCIQCSKFNTSYVRLNLDIDKWFSGITHILLKKKKKIVDNAIFLSCTKKKLNYYVYWLFLHI